MDVQLKRVATSNSSALDRWTPCTFAHKHYWPIMEMAKFDVALDEEPVPRLELGPLLRF